MENISQEIQFVEKNSTTNKQYAKFTEALEAARLIATEKNPIWITKEKQKFIITNDIEQLKGKFIIACHSSNTEMDKAIIEAFKLSQKNKGFFHVIKIDDEFKAVHEIWLNKNPKYQSLILIR